MNLRDIHRGMTVYHTIYTHLGPGVVEKITVANGLERAFERGGSYRIIVRWANGDTSRQQVRSLRKTPNRKKILCMVELYRLRGSEAQDGGDRLILPSDSK